MVKKFNFDDFCMSENITTVDDFGKSGKILDRPGTYVITAKKFNPDDSRIYNKVEFVGGGGTGGEGFAIVSDESVVTVVITEPGINYTSAPRIVFPKPGCGADGTVQISGGSLVGVDMISGGKRYRNTVQAALTILSQHVRVILKTTAISQKGVNKDGTINPFKMVPWVICILIPDLLPNNYDPYAVGLNNISVEGICSLNGFSMAGIYAMGHLQNLNISKNVLIQNSGKLASLSSRTANPSLSYYVPFGFPGYPGSMPFIVGGIIIGESNALGLGPSFFTQNVAPVQNKIVGLKLSSVSSVNNFYTDFCLNNTKQIELNNSHFDRAYSDDPTISATSVLIGAYVFNIGEPDLNNIVNFVARDCSFNGTKMGVGDFSTELVDYNAPWNCFLGSINNANFYNCQFNDAYCDFAGDIQGGSSIGLVLYYCNNLNFYNSSFDAQSSLNGGEGMSVYLSNNIYCSKCTADGITQIGLQQLPAPAIATGIQASGFSVDGLSTGIVLDRCTSNGLTVTGPCNVDTIGQGFAIAASSNTTLIQCVSDGIIMQNGGYAVNFNLEDDGYGFSNVKFIGCVGGNSNSMVPTLSGVVQGPAIAFAGVRYGDFPGEGVCSWTSCKALECTGAEKVYNGILFDGYTYSAGFSIYSTVPGSPLLGFEFTDNQSIGNTRGYYFDNCKNFVFRGENRADNNIIEGFTAKDSHILYQGTKAYNNGTSKKYYGPHSNYNVAVQKLSITNVTNTDPITITISETAPPTGTMISITDVSGNTAANGVWSITNTGSNTFTIPAAGNGTYTTGGTVSVAPPLYLVQISSLVLPSYTYVNPTPTAGNVNPEAYNISTIN